MKPSLKFSTAHLNGTPSASPALSKRSAPATSSLTFGNAASGSNAMYHGVRQLSSGSSGMSSSQSNEDHHVQHIQQRRMSPKSKGVSRWMTQVESGIDQGSKSSASTNPSPALDPKFRPVMPFNYHANPMDAIRWDDEYSRSDSEGCGGSDDVASSVYDNSPVYRPPRNLQSIN